MKKFLSSVAKKAAEVANDVAAYNTGGAQHPAGRPTTAVVQGHKSKDSGSHKGSASSGQGAPADASGPPFDPLKDPVLQYLLRNVRSRHVRNEFAKTPQSKYIETHDVRLLAASYNVNGKKPPSGARLDAWLSQWKDAWPAAVGLDGQQLPAGPDVVAVGFQEIVPLQVGSVMGVTGLGNIEAWDRALAAHLNGEEWAAKAYGPVGPAQGAGSTGGAPTAAAAAGSAAQVQQAAHLAHAQVATLSGAQFVQVASKQMVGLYVSVWVRQQLLPFLRGVQVTAVATGFGGYVGNKGAVAVRMRVHDSPLVFVVAHLSSGDQEGDQYKRNADVAEVLRRAAFGTQPDSMTSTSAALISSSLGPGHWGEARSVMDHENAVWLGDLNYRLSGISDDDARKAIHANRVEALLAADQLLQEMEAGRVFQGWVEPPITFLPTFKFKVGTNYYLGDPLPPSSSRGSGLGGAGGGQDAQSQSDAASEVTEDADDQLAPGETAAPGEKQKKRTPAYCDRVLWTPSPSRSLHSLAYGRGELALSDHKPVAAAFLLRARRYNREQVEAVLEAARRTVDAMILASRPRCSVEPNVVCVGTVRYGEPVTFTVAISNSGGGEGLFHFVPLPHRPRSKVVLAAKGATAAYQDEDEPALPPWLSAEPMEGVLEPGASRDICMTVLVEGGSKGSTGTLAASTDHFLMPPTVILRVEDNSDFFITAEGSYLRTVQGTPLKSLSDLGDTPLVTEAQDQAALPSQLLQGWSPFSLPPAPPLPSTPSIAGVPKEFARLLAFLARPSSLATPGLFVDSIAEVLQLQPGAGAADGGGGDAGDGGDGTDPSGAGAGAGSASVCATCVDTQRKLLQPLARLRASLDAHRDFPPGTSPHEAAALLLALLAALPKPLMPPAATEVCYAMFVPMAIGAAGLLRESMGPTGLCTLRSLVALCKSALLATEFNGLGGTSLARTVAEHVFPPATGAANSEAVLQSRANFVLLLIDPNTDAEL